MIFIHRRDLDRESFPIDFSAPHRFGVYGKGRRRKNKFESMSHHEDRSFTVKIALGQRFGRCSEKCWREMVSSADRWRKK